MPDEHFEFTYNEQTVIGDLELTRTGGMGEYGALADVGTLIWRVRIDAQPPFPLDARPSDLDPTPRGRALLAARVIAAAEGTCAC